MSTNINQPWQSDYHQMVDALWDFTNSTSRTMRRAAALAAAGHPLEEINAKTGLERESAKIKLELAIALARRLEEYIERTAAK